ncbi:transmembrane protein 143-like isoform X1 [Argonauta hians]
MATYLVHSMKWMGLWLSPVSRRISYLRYNRYQRSNHGLCFVSRDTRRSVNGSQVCSKPSFALICSTSPATGTNHAPPHMHHCTRPFCTDSSCPSQSYREHYIPITRYSVIHQLLNNGSFLAKDVSGEFLQFSLALDNVIVTRYQGVLQDIKWLFDPINPDKDTIQTRNLTKEERNTKETQVLQQLDALLKKANFHKLSNELVEKSLMESPIKGGIRIQVDPSKYEILHFWALGRKSVSAKCNWYGRMWNMFPKSRVPHPEHYSRLIVALRLRGQTKLVLKGFKDIPTDALEMLLPDCKVKLNPLDKGIITASISIAVTGVLAKILTTLVELKFQWSFVSGLILSLIAVRIWTVYKNRKNSYLVKLSQMLYYKNLANNRSLLTMLVDRAEDESFKEAMIIYTFLMARQGTELYQLEKDGFTNKVLEKEIEDWILSVTGTRIEFDSREAIALLKSFDILRCNNNNNNNQLTVEPLPIATQLLSKNFAPFNTFNQGSSLSEKIKGLGVWAGLGWGEMGLNSDGFVEGQEEVTEGLEAIKRNNGEGIKKKDGG